MFGFGPATRIYLAVGATDLRKSFEGLFGLVRDRLLCCPTSGHVFLFCNQQRNRLKLLVFDGSGLWVCAKRLERGRFAWPQAGDAHGKVRLSQEELTLLVSGIDLSQTERKRWYRKVMGEELSEEKVGQSA
jgi:transposase